MTDGHTALVLGATGLVGSALLTQLLEDNRYTKVRCLTRRAFAVDDVHQEKLELVIADLDKLADHSEAFNVDHVYVCLGTTIKNAGSKAAFKQVDYDFVLEAAKLAAQQHCRSFVWISSVGADADSSNFYLSVKGQLEQAIAELEATTQYACVRPSLLLGERDEFRFGERVGIVFAKLLSPLMFGSLKKYRPVHAHDVALSMINKQDFHG